MSPIDRRLFRRELVVAIVGGDWASQGEDFASSVSDGWLRERSKLYVRAANAVIDVIEEEQKKDAQS